MRKEERIQELINNGINVDAFIAMGLPEGAKVTIDLPGGVTQEIELLLKKFKDMDAIKADPYFSRWTMAQVFDVLRSGKSVERYLKWKFAHPYRYQFTCTLDRVRELASLSVGKRKNTLEKFFNPRLAIKLAECYLDDLRKYIGSLPEKSHEGRPYKKVGSAGNIHTKDIEGLVFSPLERELDSMRKYCFRNEILFCKHFEEFIDSMVKWDDRNLPLNPYFVAAYQGRGAYLTATGLVEFHGCRVYPRAAGRYSWTRGEKLAPLSREESIKVIDDKVAEISRNVWRTTDWYMLWGMMKEIIEDNGFDFYKVMKEKYGK